MKANLAQREPETLAFWEKNKLYEQLIHKKKTDKAFYLHSGPPYANGHIHIGHALNMILKDIFTKAHRKLGYYAPLTPGWDCHGLPIEWKIEEKYRKKKLNKDDVDPSEFRAECRNFAKEWMDIQREEFKRLGILAHWDKPYCTMDFSTEGKIVSELLQFLMNGALYKGTRPVMWSVVEKTALADAEVEYRPHISDSIYVGFLVKKAPFDALNDARVLIWTTTPWTIPANRAVAYHRDVTYVLFNHAGKKYIAAKNLLEEVAKALGVDVESFDIKHTFQGKDLEGVICHHPLYQKGYDFDVPLLHGDHVTTDAGTGLVHTAPSHGLEDFHLGKEYGLECPHTVEEDGRYASYVPLFAGEHVYKVNPLVIEALKEAESLLHHSKFEHSYPHSWRSKAPLIYRNTSQWFINVDHNGLREKALASIRETGWYPASGLNRILSMVENRPDWCISRQRAWGTPITLFVHKQTGALLKDEEINKRIVSIIEKEGADAWFNSDAKRFLGDSYNAEDYDQVKDILDVWFDSGTTHTFVNEQRDEEKWPATLYLEGSDQHRGWFQSSLLHSCGTRGRAPYDNVCTHGYVLDGQGHKMSKSLGNVIAPETVMSEMGADVLRLWVSNVDYNDDMRISMDMLKHQQDIYRRFRNTLRYLLGALAGYDEAQESIDYEALPELEKWVLHRLSVLHSSFKEATTSFNMMDFYHNLHTFCSIDLSAYYFDIRKDTLYCDSFHNPQRKATRLVFNHVLTYLLHWLAPVLSFTAEEAYWTRHGLGQNDGKSIHLLEAPETPHSWTHSLLCEKWDQVRRIRSVVTGALEIERSAKTIGSSLQAHVTLYLSSDMAEQLKDIDWADLCITSSAHVVVAKPVGNAFTLDDVAHVGVSVSMAEGEKCARCWKVLPEVFESKREEKICKRCEEAVNAL